MKLATFGIIVLVLAAVGFFLAGGAGGVKVPYVYGSKQLYWIIAGAAGLLLAFAGRKSNKGFEREPKGRNRNTQKNI